MTYASSDELVKPKQGKDGFHVVVVKSKVRSQPHLPAGLRMLKVGQTEFWGQVGLMRTGEVLSSPLESPSRPHQMIY